MTRHKRRLDTIALIFWEESRKSILSTAETNPLGVGIENWLFRTRDLLLGLFISGGAPGYLINYHGHPDSLYFLSRLRNAGCCQGWIVPEQVLVSVCADKDARTARKALESAGQVYFPAKNSVILLLGLRTHETGRGDASVNTTAQQ